MKPSFLLIILILIAIPILLMSFTKARIEKQKYRVVKKDKEFEIRFYPPAIFATTRSAAKSYRELGSSGFRKIAGYIFGNNETSAKIAMTAPVHMDINDTLSTMSFVMPSNYTEENLPKPNDKNVKIKIRPEEYIAVLKFGGYASDEELKEKSEKLFDLLKENKITTLGNYRFLGYTPPYQFIDRRNEIAVTIEWHQ